MLPCLVLSPSPWLGSSLITLHSYCLERLLPNTSDFSATPSGVKPISRHWRHWRDPTPTLPLVSQEDTDLSVFFQEGPQMLQPRPRHYPAPKIQKAITPRESMINLLSKAEAPDEITWSRTRSWSRRGPLLLLPHQTKRSRPAGREQQNACDSTKKDAALRWTGTAPHSRHALPALFFGTLKLFYINYVQLIRKMCREPET